jgi:CubicO group peptidase (beta-lactamase class C family)
MKNESTFQLRHISKLWLSIIALTTFSCGQKNEPTPSAQGNAGIIYAKPEDVASNIPLEKVIEISSFFSRPENKVRIQFPGPESQYAWQNMSKFLPTAQILRGGEISKLPYAIQPGIGDISYVNAKGESNTVNSHFEKFPIDAMIVVKDGKIVYERYKTMRPEDKHIWYSCAKVLGPTVLLSLEEEGKVDINKPVSTYLTELSGTVWDSVMIREALNMATGLNGTEHDEPNRDSRTNPEQIWFQWAGKIGLVPVMPGKENDTWVDVLRKMERRKPAYSAFEYNSINTFVINRIVERAGGKTLAEQISDRIWTKLGMEHDAYMIVSNSGYSLGFFGMNTTLRDMARYGMLFTPSVSSITDEPVLTPAQISKMQKGTHPEMYTKGMVGALLQSHFPDETGITVNYQWDAVFTNGDMYKSGVGGQGLYVSPSTNTVIAWFCTGTGRNQEETMAREIVKSLK